MEGNADHSTAKIQNNNTNPQVLYIQKQIDELERRFEERLKELRDELEQATRRSLISPTRAAEILDVTVSAIRKRGNKGTLIKYNADGSRKITNRRTPVYFDENEVRNKI